MIHVYYGEGKGKTTAALGLAIRAAGNDFPVLIVQFLKGRTTGEVLSLERMPNIIVFRNKKDYGFYKDMSEETKREVTRMHNTHLQKVWELIKEKKIWMIVLDEIFSAYQYELVDKELVERIVKQKELEIVCTGRNPDSYFLEAADYITQMRKERHPYEKGITARKGVEF